MIKIDHTIISKCKSFDKGSQKLLYNALYDYIRNVSLRYSNNDSVVDDIVQETFINIFTKINQFDSAKGNFSSWAVKIAINQSFHSNKKNRKNKFVEITDFVFPSKRNTPIAIDKITVDEVLKILKTMPEKYYCVYSLYIIEGYSHSEISSLLNISAELSRKRLSRGKKWVIDIFKDTEIANVNYLKGQII